MTFLAWRCKEMSDAKHTSGPWLIDGSIIYSDSQDDNAGVCTVWNDAPWKERIANAHIIAAAPDMLDALETAFDMLKKEHLLNPESVDKMNKIMKAIDKAKGEV
jgi:hypothetical protein